MSYSFLVEVEAIQPDCEGAPNGSDQSLNSRIVGYTEVEIPPVVHRYGKLGTRHVVYM